MQPLRAHRLLSCNSCPQTHRSQRITSAEETSKLADMLIRINGCLADARALVERPALTHAETKRLDSLGLEGLQACIQNTT
jgi:hypothetical protein